MESYSSRDKSTPAPGTPPSPQRALSFYHGKVAVLSKNNRIDEKIIKKELREYELDAFIADG
eukprot:2470916-Pleurochrysis_carterae.AAC.1